MNFGSDPLKRNRPVALSLALAAALSFLPHQAQAQNCATVVGTATGATATIIIPSIAGPSVQIITSTGINITFDGAYGLTLVNGIPTRIIFFYKDPATGNQYEGEIDLAGGVEQRITGTLTVTIAGRERKVTTFNLAQPDIKVTAVMFNHKPQTAANDDALDIRADYTHNLRFQRPNPAPAGNLPAGSVGEWILNLANPDPALWLADKAVTVKARFTVNTNAVTSADLAATAVGGTIPNVTMKNVTFANGVSANPAYVDFNLSRNTDNMISKRVDSWQWTVTNVNGCGGQPRNINRSGAHTLYTVLDTPTSPWYSTYRAGPMTGRVIPNQQPWVTALEFAIARAGTNGIATVPGADAQITRYLHDGFGLFYDTVGGAPSYCSANFITTTTFNLTGYMARNPTRRVNCYDQGAGVTVFTNLIGGNAQYRYMGPPPPPPPPQTSGFGYINFTVLVGPIDTDSPFYAKTNTPQLAGNTCAPVRTLFGNHVFSLLGPNVYDATAGPHTGTETVAQYIANTIDVSGKACHAAAAGKANNVKGAATLAVR
jgi:hypothetical protein